MPRTRRDLGRQGVDGEGTSSEAPPLQGEAHPDTSTVQQLQQNGQHRRQQRRLFEVEEAALGSSLGSSSGSSGPSEVPSVQRTEEEQRRRLRRSSAGRQVARGTTRPVRRLPLRYISSQNTDMGWGQINGTDVVVGLLGHSKVCIISHFTHWQLSFA